MSEKEKAQQLVEQLLPIVRGADRYNYNLEDMNVFIAKQCALIFVNEIIDEWTKEENRLGKISYWIKVKEELLELLIGCKFPL